MGPELSWKLSSGGLAGGVLRFTSLGLFAAAVGFCLASPVCAAGELELLANVPMSKAREIGFTRGRAWVGRNFDGLTVVDIENPREPKVHNHFPGEVAQPLHFKIISPRLLVMADRFRGLILWDISNEDRPTTLSQLSLPGITTNLDVAEYSGRRIAAVASAGEGMTVVDITDATSPTLLSKFTTQVDFSRRVLLRENVAFLSDHFNGGLKLINLADPANPQPWFQVAMRGFVEHAILRDDLLYVNYRNYGVRLFRYTPGEEPTTTPTLTLLSSLVRSRSMVRTTLPLAGSRLFVANDEAGVELYDVADPTLPVLVDEYTFAEPAQSAQTCAEHEGIVYVPCWDGGLNVFRVVPKH